MAWSSTASTLDQNLNRSSARQCRLWVCFAYRHERVEEAHRRICNAGVQERATNVQSGERAVFAMAVEVHGDRPARSAGGPDEVAVAHGVVAGLEPAKNPDVAAVNALADVVNLLTT